MLEKLNIEIFIDYLIWNVKVYHSVGIIKIGHVIEITIHVHV